MITRGALRSVLEAAEVDDDRVRWSYSGRFMYGATCFGFVGSLRDLARFFAELGAYAEAGRDGDADPLVTDDDVQDLVTALRSDDLGRDTIFYFPGVEVRE